ncbi:ABC transporter [Clostridium sp. DMHC 10]|nr:ABC transporter [Clostridium sp. DMHC 10]
MRNVSYDFVLELKNLKSTYYNSNCNIFGKGKAVKVLKAVNFNVKKGEIFGIVGESGCGKSTLARSIVKLNDNVEGDILIEGQDIKHIKNISEKVQIVFQDPLSSLNPKRTIGWILEEPLKIHRKGNKKERIKRVNEILELVGLDSSYRERYPHELSGGQRQRISIGSAIILNPKFVVLDEPVSALDVSVQAQILNLMMDLHHKLNLSFLFISHNLNVVYYMCDRVAVMYLGEIVELASAEEIYNDPKHPYTKALLNSVVEISTANNRDEVIIKGDLNDSLNISAGCKCYARCSGAKKICKTVSPEIKNINTKDGSEHLVRCHLYNFN